MNELVKWPFPWFEPKTAYDTDGPTEDSVIKFPGADYHVSRTQNVGIHSGRGRFRVECLTCKEVLHENTTGTSSRIRGHHQQRHVT